jgi:hypothetical protein
MGPGCGDSGFLLERRASAVAIVIYHAVLRFWQAAALTTAVRRPGRT